MMQRLMHESFEKLILPIGDLLTGQSVMRHLRFFREAQGWSPERLKQWQDDRLRETVRLAYEQTPFYRALYDQARVRPEDIRGIEDLEKLPVVTKDLLRPAYPDACTRGVVTRYTEISTSGSTGAPFRVRVDAESMSAARALMFLRAEFSGWQIGAPYLQTGMTLQRGAVRGVKDKLLGCHYVSAFDLSDAVLDAYLDLIGRRGLRYVMGYAASLYMLAKRAHETRSTLALEGAISWGDNMFPAYRQLIEAQFQCRVTDTYGCSEGIQIAAQCGERHGGYHIFAPHVAIELLNGGRRAQPGESGEVFLTRLNAGAMPLIRYRIGDLARYAAEQECACGCRWPMLSGVDGRSTDVVLTPRGNRLIVHFFTGIFEYARSIRAFQVVQENVNGITVKVVPNGELDAAEWADLTRQIAERGDPELEVRLELVEDIPLEKSNKRRFVISRLQHSQAV